MTICLVSAMRSTTSVPSLLQVTHPTGTVFIWQRPVAPTEGSANAIRSHGSPLVRIPAQRRGRNSDRRQNLDLRFGATRERIDRLANLSVRFCPWRTCRPAIAANRAAQHEGGGSLVFDDRDRLLTSRTYESGLWNVAHTLWRSGPLRSGVTHTWRQRVQRKQRWAAPAHRSVVITTQSLAWQ